MSGFSLFAAERAPFAVFSECGLYRYVLGWPTGLSGDSYALFVLANPSTATAEQTDPTVARTVAYARGWGYAWSRVVNVRAWRETNPKRVPPDPAAVGPENNSHILEQARGAAIVICGWGKLGGTRGPLVLDLIRSAGKVPHALKLNGDGSPGHPLYLRSDAAPRAIANAAATAGATDAVENTAPGSTKQHSPIT